MATTIETTRELQITLSDDEGHTSSFKLPNPLPGISTETSITSAMMDILLGDPEGTEADNMFAVDGVFQPTNIKMETIETTRTKFIDTTSE